METNPSTNQLSGNGAQRDSNGNLTACGTGSYAVAYVYDVENRLSSAAPVGTTEDVFGYENLNQRVYQGNYNTSWGAYSNELIYFYGAGHKKLACWSLQVSGSSYTDRHGNKSMVWWPVIRHAKQNPQRRLGSLTIRDVRRWMLNELLDPL